MSNNNQNNFPRSENQTPVWGGGDAKKRWQVFGILKGQQRSSSDVKPEVRREWHQVQDELQRFERSVDAGTTQFLEPASVITKSHWVKNSDRSNCSNKACKRALWAASKHHCRKCGDIFCAKCLQFQRRLSQNAEYDPNGWLCKVCEKCYCSEPQGIGVTRSWTYDFKMMRTAIQNRDNTKLTRAAAQRMCKKLVEGFQANYTFGTTPPTTPMSATPPQDGNNVLKGKNPFKLLRNGVTKVVQRSIPDWQKPPNWVSEGLCCQCCNRPYGRLETQHNCRICGQLVCKNQSSKDLLLFTPDKSDRAEMGSEPRWVIIKVIGCPELEPDHRLYLRVCHPCRDLLRDMQVEEQQRALDGSGPIDLCWQQLVDMYRDIIAIQSKIDACFPEFQKLIDGLEIQAGAPTKLPPNRNNMQLLAKHQGDLSDHLSSFAVTIPRLKKLDPQTRMQVKLVKSLIRCKFNYYVENNSVYKQLRKQLEEITPPEVLQEIQSIVDAKAINSACLSLNQLAFECLHLCVKHELEQTLPMVIKQSAEMCDADLKKKLESNGENWEEHKQQITLFVRLQMKGDAEANIKPRPFIRPSRRMVKMGGATYVEWFLNQRVYEVVGKIRLQLLSRTADRSFRPTKESLDKLRQSLHEEEEEGDQK